MSVLTEMINDMQHSAQEYAHAIFSKVLMGVSAPSIVYQLNELLPDFLAQPVIWLLGRVYQVEWVELLSSIAIAMLILERFYAIRLSIAKRREIENGNSSED
jgi:hypothetical protein